MYASAAQRELARGKRQDQLDRWKTADEEWQATNKDKLQASAVNDLVSDDTKPKIGSSKEKRPRFSADLLFLDAVRQGDIAEADRYLSIGADVNARNIEGLSALHDAATNNDVLMIEFLVANGASLDIRDEDGWSPLHAAAHWGSNKAIELLVDKGADLLAVNSDNDVPFEVTEFADTRDRFRILMDAAEITDDDIIAAKQAEAIQMLNDIDADLVVDKNAALHVAASKGYVQVAQSLLDHGVDIEAVDDNGWTALHAAAYWDCLEVIRMLVQRGANLDAKTKREDTPLDLAVSKHTQQLLKELKKRSKKSLTPGSSVANEKSSRRLSVPRNSSLTRPKDISKLEAIQEGKSARHATFFTGTNDKPGGQWKLELSRNDAHFRRRLCVVLIVFVIVVGITLACFAASIALFIVAGKPCLPFQQCSQLAAPTSIEMCLSATSCGSCGHISGCTWCPSWSAGSIDSDSFGSGICLPGGIFGVSSAIACDVIPFIDNQTLNACLSCPQYQTTQCFVASSTLYAVWATTVAVGGLAMIFGLVVLILWILDCILLKRADTQDVITELQQYARRSSGSTDMALTDSDRDLGVRSRRARGEENEEGEEEEEEEDEDDDGTKRSSMIVLDDEEDDQLRPSAHLEEDESQRPSSMIVNDLDAGRPTSMIVHEEEEDDDRYLRDVNLVEVANV